MGRDNVHRVKEAFMIPFASQKAGSAPLQAIYETKSPFLSLVREEARLHFSKAKGSHDWDHTLRVFRLCRKIGTTEGADPLVTQAAAYLHDIGRVYQDLGGGKICHAAKGAVMAEEILAACPIDECRRQNIIHCIAAHRFRKGEKPQTLEAKVVFDADKLDAIGAIGVARAFLFAAASCSARIISSFDLAFCKKRE